MITQGSLSLALTSVQCFIHGNCLPVWLVPCRSKWHLLVLRGSPKLILTKVPGSASIKRAGGKMKNPLLRHNHWLFGISPKQFSCSVYLFIFLLNQLISQWIAWNEQFWYCWGKLPVLLYGNWFLFSWDLSKLCVQLMWLSVEPARKS